MKKVKEAKLVVTENLRCEECGEEYIYDLFWCRQYRAKMRSSPLNTEHFHSLCPKHKLIYFAREFARAYLARLIDDRDLEKMGISREFKNG